ncbi:MAG: tRNA (adenosine(37)-N6)-threonylcarbamoyltransferase complex ATPase subunit type 1 TsaE [Cardiobacteriaceae bacterium]|nr:tRNA (adenosine(37)-N6)-threonylcarbamoyltransferase complex ATPase subunit type 1 TsaE [Cardiobacteriaceae bacterium]
MTDLEQTIKNLQQYTDKKVYYLEGPLGVGKTTFVQQWLKTIGYQGIVKSPTYALIHEYHINKQTIIHADLYRLSTPDELLYLDVQDWCDRATYIFIEWAQNGGIFLPAPDILCQFSYQDSCRYLSVTEFSH